MSLTIKQWLAIGALVALLGALAFAYHKGKNKADFSAVVGTVTTQQQAGEISRATTEQVAQEQWALEQQASRDEESINAAIRANPGTHGPADPAVLRVAQDAHARAICAAGRVSGEGRSEATSCAAEHD